MILAALLYLLTLLQPAPAFDPTSRYTVREVEGWKVYVSQRLLTENRPQADAALRLLETKLYDVKRAVPPGAAAELRKVPIWLELRDRKFPCACYHPSPEWLTANGYNPEKAGGVEIANAGNFLTWTREQPSMVLHELAHAYHHRVLGHGHPEVKAAYEKAVAAKTYEAVLHWDGKTVRAYALNNDQEYFAELTEAYFGTNDFYPFVRAELQRHDPEGYRIIAKLWATPRPRVPEQPESRPTVLNRRRPSVSPAVATLKLPLRTPRGLR